MSIITSFILAVAPPVNSLLIFYRDFLQSVCMNSFLSLYHYPINYYYQFQSVQN
nr:MAG TPA: hypothetical protein [Bacteriophage sp.]